MSAQLEELDARATAATKQAAILESQLNEAQELQQEETRQKIAYISRTRQLENEKANLQEQLDEEEESKKNLEKQLSILTVQVFSFFRLFHSRFCFELKAFFLSILLVTFAV